MSELKIDQILKEIEKRQISYASQTWVPSLQKEIRFLEINTSQQKRLVKSILDSSVLNTEFILTLRDIIKENCIDNTVNIDDLTIIDKLFISIGMRSNSIGNLIPVDIQTKEKETINLNINLDDVLKIAKETIDNIEGKTIEDKVFKIECGLPTIGSEVQLENQLHKNKEVSVESKQQFKDVISESFLETIIPYIKSVVINAEQGPLVLPWNTLDSKERLEVVNKFSTKILKEVLGYINSIQQQIEKIEVVNFKHKDAVYRKRLSIEGSDFFILS